MSASMAEGMAAILAEHVPTTSSMSSNQGRGGGSHGRSCSCGFVVTVEYAELGDDEPSTTPLLNTKLAAHQAEVLAANGYGKLEEAKAPEVRYVTLDNGETELDEIVARNASVHLEAMDDNHWWMAIESGGTRYAVNLYTQRAKITAHAEED